MDQGCRAGFGARINVRFVRNRFSFLVCSVLVLTVTAVSASALADPDRMTLSRISDAVVVSGTQLLGLDGKGIANIRVFVFTEGALTAVPFQIDQRNSSGNWVWDAVFERNHNFAFDEDFAPIEGAGTVAGRFQTHDDEDAPGEARLDGNDMLVFLAKDAGARGDATKRLPGADTVIEIEIVDPVDGTNGWVYVAHFNHEPPPYSSVRYISHSPQEKRIDTTFYQFNYSETCIVCIEDLRILGTPMIDRINIRGKVRVELGFIHRSINFAETDIHGFVEGIIEGPVRIIKRHVVHLELWHLIRTADVTCDHFYYPGYAEIPICLPLRFPITEASVSLLTELHDTPLHRTLIGETDGSIVEYGQGVRTLDARHNLHLNWIAFDSPHGSVVSFVELPNEIAAHAQARPCLCDEAVGTMDADIPTVAGPVAGIVVKSGKDCPRGPHVLHGTYVISPHPYYPGNEVRAHHLAHTGLITNTTLLDVAP